MACCDAFHSAIDTRVFVMPSGSKIRVRTKSSHGIFEAPATTSPARENMMFWDWYVLRNGLLSFSDPTERINCSGDQLGYAHSLSRPERPVRGEGISRTVISE